MWYQVGGKDGTRGPPLGFVSVRAKNSTIIKLNRERLVSARQYHIHGCDRHHVTAIEFVGLENGVLVPICPIHPILEQ